MREMRIHRIALALFVIVLTYLMFVGVMTEPRLWKSYSSPSAPSKNSVSPPDELSLPEYLKKKLELQKLEPQKYAAWRESETAHYEAIIRVTPKSETGILRDARAHLDVLEGKIVASASERVGNEDARDLLAMTGCNSRYSDDKKSDLFGRFKGRQMTATGRVVSVDHGEVALKLLPSTLTYDLQVQMRDSRSVYDLERGQFLTVQFRMLTQGGCVLPYGGDQGTVVHVANPR